MCSNKNHPSEPLSERKRRKRISPSRARRNARRLQAFLDRKKQSLMPVDDQKDSELVPTTPSKTLKSVCNSDLDGGDNLRIFIDKEVSCIDFAIDNGEPGLNLELHSGKTVWTPVCVKKPDVRDENLSLADLSGMDEVVFLSSTDDTPGVVLKSGKLEVWTPIATRTRSRVRDSDKPPDFMEL